MDKLSPPISDIWPRAKLMAKFWDVSYSSSVRADFCKKHEGFFGLINKIGSENWIKQPGCESYVCPCLLKKQDSQEGNMARLDWCVIVLTTLVQDHEFVHLQAAWRWWNTCLLCYDFETRCNVFWSWESRYWIIFLTSFVILTRLLNSVMYPF